MQELLSEFHLAVLFVTTQNYFVTLFQKMSQIKLLTLNACNQTLLLTAKLIWHGI